MKKFIPIIAICVATICSFAAETYKFPGWKSTDISNIDKYISVCEANKNTRTMIVCLVIKDFAQNGVPKTFDAYKDVIEKHAKYACQKNGITAEQQIKFEHDFATLQIALFRGEFLKEAYAFGVESGNFYVAYYYMSSKTDGVIEPAVKYRKMVDALTTDQFSNNIGHSSLISPMIDAIVKYSVIANIDSATVKKDFQNLNRIYSINLVKNKKKYEPIVAKIRTIIETL